MSKLKKTKTAVTRSALTKQRDEPSKQDIDSLIALFSQARYVEGEISARDLTRRFPGHGYGWKVLGAMLKLQGRNGDAILPMQMASRLMPWDEEAHQNLGNTLVAQGRIAESEECRRRLLKIRPDSAETHCQLGVALIAQERTAEAETCLLNALRINPNYDVANNILGNMLKEQRRFPEAESCFRRVLAIRPDSVDVMVNLGIVIEEQDRSVEAETLLRRAIAISPTNAEAHYSLGNAIRKQGRISEAGECFLKTLACDPSFTGAHNNLGNVALHQGNIPAAEAYFRRTVEIATDPEDAFGNLLFTLNYHPDKSADEIFLAYREYDRRFGLPHQSSWQEHDNSRDPNRRLKIGYVSADFMRHAASYFLEPLLARHNKQEVEVYAYANLTGEDDTTRRYRDYADHWIPTKNMSDAALAERIRADQIDILVDLSGHTSGNRLQVFARKPAPVSLSWLGYGYTTGLTAVDYFLTDAIIAPKGSETLFSEQPWRIETPAFTYRPDPGMGHVSALPALERGKITFGSLSRAIRINHRTIRVWSEILRRVNNSRLVIDNGNFKETVTSSALLEEFGKQGISPEQLVIGCHSPPWDVLRGIDIGLDCFPHNSGTTLFETLYMGIPYVTQAGRPGVGRLGSSILHGIGHPEWIADNDQQYVDIAVTLATDLAKLAELRAGLRKKMESSMLMNEAEFTRKVETAYREMFVNWTKQNHKVHQS